MRVTTERIDVRTQGRGFTDVTAELTAIVARTGVARGICSIFVRHTSASLLVQENADPSVRRDLEAWLDALAPEGADYAHDAEGPDDMPAHLKAAVTRTSETLPIVDGKLALGTWQALYLVEHRRAAHTRTILATVIGE